MKRGAFIVFEGCDRSGKTTQCQKVLQWFQQSGKAAHFMRFPDRTTTIGSMVGKYLECKAEMEDHAVHLLFSANRWEKIADMKKILLAGTNLVVDRYAYSGAVFSAAKPGMDLKWCQQSDVGLLKPDLVIFLDVDPVVAQNRGEYGVERYENPDMQSKVRQNYLQLKEPYWKVVDANRTPDEVHMDVLSVIKEAIENVQPDLQQLWI